MIDERRAAEVERLARLAAGDPAAPGFAALAEAMRRAGQAEEALRTADAGLRARPDHAAGRVARALALLDLARVGEARRELERVLGDVPDHPVALRALEEAAHAPLPEPSFPALDEAEIEDAFEAAEAESEEMVDANRLAEAALAAVEDGAPEVMRRRPWPESPFATETVAELLERQGHGGEARAVRDALARRGPSPADGRDRSRVIATLERWLENLRRGPR